jgi:hypothetical protein
VLPGAAKRPLREARGEKLPRQTAASANSNVAAAGANINSRSRQEKSFHANAAMHCNNFISQQDFAPTVRSRRKSFRLGPK